MGKHRAVASPKRSPPRLLLFLSSLHFHPATNRQALRSTSCVDAKAVFRRLFQEFGMPERIRTDNGLWNLYFGPLRLGRLSEQHMRIEDEHGSLWRHKKKQKL